MLISTNICEAFSVSFSPPALKTMSSSAASSLTAETTIWAPSTTPRIAESSLKLRAGGALPTFGISCQRCHIKLLRGKSLADWEPHFAETIQPIRGLSGAVAVLMRLPPLCQSKTPIQNAEEARWTLREFWHIARSSGVRRSLILKSLLKSPARIRSSTQDHGEALPTWRERGSRIPAEPAHWQSFLPLEGLSGAEPCPHISHIENSLH